jgi:hypothetical protein
MERVTLESESMSSLKNYKFLHLTGNYGRILYTYYSNETHTKFAVCWLRKAKDSTSPNSKLVFACEKKDEGLEADICSNDRIFIADVSTFPEGLTIHSTSPQIDYIFWNRDFISVKRWIEEE